MIPRDLVLENEHVRLEPLDFCHAPDLHEAGNDEEVWRKTMRTNPFATLFATQRYIGEALFGDETAPDGIPFAIIDKQVGKAVGGTRYFDISAKDRSLEIGWTWLARRYWRTHVNTKCKLLLLLYAFEQAQVLRVQFKADAHNDRSRAALERLGAIYEGTLRDARNVEGRLRSISYYSILADEWAAVARHLHALLEQHAQAVVPHA